MVTRLITAVRHRWKTPEFWLLVAIGLFVLYMGASVWFRHHNLFTAQFDMGNMDQVLWQSLHGRWFQMIDPGSAQPSHSDQHPRRLLTVDLLAVLRRSGRVR